MAAANADARPRGLATLAASILALATVVPPAAVAQSASGTTGPDGGAAVADGEAPVEIPYDDILGEQGRRALVSPWPQSTVTFVVRSGSPDLTGEDDIIAAAARAWDEASGVRLEPGSQGADIRVDFYTGAHGDGEPFDGPYGVLAHAAFPGSSPMSGDIHFDDAETWTSSLRDDGAQPLDLFTVALHELGHSLGLEHSDDPDAVMYATYSGSRRELAADDRRAIRALYPSDIAFGDLAVDQDAVALVGQLSGAGGDDLQLSLPGSGNDRRLHGGAQDEFVQAGSAANEITGSYDEWMVGDFAGDGADDVWLHQAGPGGDRMLVSSGSGYDNRGAASFDVQGRYDEYLVGDFSGDGRTDVWLHDVGAGNDRMLVATGSGGFRNFGTASVDISGRYDAYMVGDFSGDGRDDVWLSRVGAGNDRMLVSQGTNAFFNHGSNSVDIAGGYDEYLVGNFSGGGGTDVHLRLEGSDNDRRLNSVGPNRMRNYGSSSTDIAGSYVRGLVGDFNGDGAADVVLDGVDDAVVTSVGANDFRSAG